MLPFSETEGDYEDGIPYERAFTPSAIYDAKLFLNMLL